MACIACSILSMGTVRADAYDESENCISFIVQETIGNVDAEFQQNLTDTLNNEWCSCAWKFFIDSVQQASDPAQTYVKSCQLLADSEIGWMLFRILGKSNCSWFLTMAWPVLIRGWASPNLMKRRAIYCVNSRRTREPTLPWLDCSPGPLPDLPSSGTIHEILNSEMVSEVKFRFRIDESVATTTEEPKNEIDSFLESFEGLLVIIGAAVLCAIVIIGFASWALYSYLTVFPTKAGVGPHPASNLTDITTE